MNEGQNLTCWRKGYVTGSEEQQATEGKINNYLQWPQLQCTKPDTMRAFLNSFLKKEFLSATPEAARKRNKVRGHV